MSDNNKQFLGEYCGAPFSVCEGAGRDCGKCNSVNKADAEERKARGVTVQEDIARINQKLAKSQ